MRQVAQDARAAADRCSRRRSSALPATADAAGHRRVLADAHVVADLDQVVELHAVLDHRVVAARRGRCRCWRRSRRRCRCAPRRAARSFPRRPRVGREAEAVGADDHARMEEAALADHAVLADASRADLSTVPAPMRAPRSITHRGPMRARGIDHRVRVDDGAGMDAPARRPAPWCFFHSWVSAREVQVGLGRDDAVAARQRRLAHGRRHDHAAGPRGRQLLLVLGVAQEAQLRTAWLLPAGPGRSMASAGSPCSSPPSASTIAPSRSGTPAGLESARSATGRRIWRR